MKTIEISKASKPLSEYALELGDDIIVLTSRDKPVAAIVSLRKVDEESLRLSTHPEFMELVEKAREEFRRGETATFDQVKREFLP
jgi:antitoxin (DNA-binding transcriptional repressor) of toxin-antitoxin stability system